MCDGCDDKYNYYDDDDDGDASDNDYDLKKNRYDIAGPKINPLTAGWPFFRPWPYSCVICHWAIYWSQIEVC
jgi:hypothetical protein